MKATARACSNIAFIKYWGNQDNTLRLPANSSISMNLDSLYTETTVIWDDNLSQDILEINHQPATYAATNRVSQHLNIIRQRFNMNIHAHISSINNFPMGAGIASSASAFAALTHGAVVASGHTLSEREMTTIARQGSGSASRSIPAGFVVWHSADTDEGSFAESIASPDYWELVDVIAIVSDEHKSTGSQAGHTTANTSDLQVARVAGATTRLESVITSIQNKDFVQFAEVVEEDSNLMHAVMMTSKPPLFYWKPTTLTVMESVRTWRKAGINVCYTLDAGPNIHCLCLQKDAETVKQRLSEIDGVTDIRLAKTGGASQII